MSLMTGTIRAAIARAGFKLSGWRHLPGVVPGTSGPSILIGAPHTSNWDFVFMLAIGWEAGIPLRWLGKKSLFGGGRGPLMRALGGIPVDRSDPSAVVTQVLEDLKQGPFHLVITPEGTRGAGSHWKSGFYRIAREANLPITLGYVDRTTMTVGLGPTLDLTGNVKADMDQVRAFYADKAGFNPKLRTEPRLRTEEDA